MKKNKVALITGITGQDGSYLAEFLLKKNYAVHGIKRRSSSLNTARIDHIYEDSFKKSAKFFLHYGDLSDSGNINNLINKIKPSEIYNLAAQSHVKLSFDSPEYTANIGALGTLRILEAIRSQNLIKKTRFYQASSSEMFGNHYKKTLNEKSNFFPLSPYATSKLFGYWITRNYRESYGIHASNGILFNHESPRRGETFVSRKITRFVASYLKNKNQFLYLGNIYANRDWGHAKDYVTGMWKIVNFKKPDDYVLSTGKTFTVKYFVEKAFKEIGINIGWSGKFLNEVGYDKSNKRVIIKISKKYYRPNELHYLKGNSSKAHKILKWKTNYTLDSMIKEMVSEDIKNLSL